MGDLFSGVRAAAANLSRQDGQYTREMFYGDYPLFLGRKDGSPFIPYDMLDMFLAMANEAIHPDVWAESWRWAAGLYVAHHAACWLRSCASAPDTAQEAAASGALVGVVKSATLGDASVSYDTSALTQATADWGDLNSTSYGQQLASRAKLLGAAGCYVI